MAAIVLDFNACQKADCKAIYFTEETGAYASSRLHGWGSPNNTTSQAETAVLTILKPDGTSTIINLFTSSFPTTNRSLEYIITNTALGLGATQSIPDGKYKFTYTVARTTATAFSFTQIKEFFFYCNAKCCIYNMFTDLDSCTSCDTEKKEQAIEAYTMYQSLVNAAKCGQSTKFANLLTLVNKLCIDSDCLTCK